MQIRPVHEDEYDRVADILTAAYAPTGLQPGDGYYDHLRDVAGRLGSAEVWVAVDDGTVLGTVTWPPLGSVEREVARDDEAEFRMLAVDPAMQGRGVGRALVEAVLDRARSEGFRHVVLSTGPWSGPAHRLYRDLGFVHAPERDRTIDADLTLEVYTLELR